MSTHLHELVSSTSSRWSEIDTLFRVADSANIVSMPGPEAIEKASRRAIVVLTVAHVEGFVKDATRAVVSDLNKFGTFSGLPNATQRIFVRQFTGHDSNGGAGSAEANQRELELIRRFSALDAKIDHEPYTQGTANPTPEVLSKICRGLGAGSPFAAISGSRLDDVFSVGLQEALLMLQELEIHLLEGLQVYPYQMKPEQFGIKIGPEGKRAATLWTTFLDDLLLQRHKIAHGASLDDSQSTDELRVTVVKAKIMIYATVLVLCSGRQAPE